MGMTNRRRIFIDEYLKCWNASEAARRAGYKSRSNTAGSRLLSNVDIKAEIERRIDENAMTADEVLQRLGDMARGDMGEFLDIESMSYSLNLEKAQEKGLTKLIHKVKDRTVMNSNSKGDETEVHTLELELYDAQAALVQLGRYHGLFTDRTEITGKDGGKITIEIIDDQYPDSSSPIAPGPG